jgi:hypothetical protein
MTGYPLGIYCPQNTPTVPYIEPVVNAAPVIVPKPVAYEYNGKALRTEVLLTEGALVRGEYTAARTHLYNAWQEASRAQGFRLTRVLGRRLSELETKLGQLQK